MTVPAYRILVLFAFILVACAGSVFPEPSAAEGLQTKWRVQPVVVETQSGRHRFSAEIADTRKLRALGLMFRRKMAPDRGMLFDFRRDEEVSMWMKNTFIPLDMIFIRADGTIHHIVENTVPHSLENISSGGRVRAVLEVNAGTAKRLGMKPGDIVRHGLFGNDG